MEGTEILEAERTIDEAYSKLNDGLIQLVNKMTIMDVKLKDENLYAYVDILYAAAKRGIKA